MPASAKRLGRTRAGALCALLVAGSFAGITAVPSPAAAGPVGTVTPYDFDLTFAPTRMATGADGNVYFTTGLTTVARITPQGAVTEFDTPAVGWSTDIAAGPDGNVWFTSYNDEPAIVRITPDGGLTPFPLPLADFEAPSALTAGPDGALWFATSTGGLGRMTTAGAVTMFIEGNPNDPDALSVSGMTAGPDGALWFVDHQKSIGRTSTTGATSFFTAPGVVPIANIAVGADGNLWFPQQGGIGRITTAGAFTSFADNRADDADSITSGPDGNLWFVRSHPSSFPPAAIGRITPAGVITVFTAPNLGIEGGDITTGADGALWFSQNYDNQIGRVTTAGAFSEFSGNGVALPRAIAAGPDGNMWVAADSGFGRLLPNGVMDLVSSPSLALVRAMVTGPDGNLWAAAYGSNAITRVTPAGAVSVVRTAKGPVEIAVGPDGNIWYLTSNAYGLPNRVVDMRTNGTVVKSFPIGFDRPRSLEFGADGSIWLSFDDYTNDRILHLSATGVVLSDTSLSLSTDPVLVAGADGNVWYTSADNDSINRIASNGTVTSFTDPSIVDPHDIVRGADDNLWFTNAGNNSIGRITPTGVVTNYAGPGISGPRGIGAGGDGRVWFTNWDDDGAGAIDTLLTGAVTLLNQPASVRSNTWLSAASPPAAGIVAVEFRATGGGLTDDVIAAATLTPYGWLGLWATGARLEGQYQVVAVATDGAGNRGRSAPIAFTIDRTAPVTQMLVPSAGETIGSPAILAAGASDNDRVARVEFLASGGGATNAVVANGTLTYYGWIAAWDTSGSPNGTYTLRSRAWDAAGNSRTSAPITVTVQH